MTRAVLFAALAALACSGPFGPFPSGHLDGRLEAAPGEGWPFAEESVLELETDPGDPYSVNVHFVANGSRLWVATVLGHSSGWGRRALADGRVRVRADHSLYDLRAVHVTDRAEIDKVDRLYREKYVVAPKLDTAQSTLVFRLEPR